MGPSRSTSAARSSGRWRPGLGRPRPGRGVLRRAGLGGGSARLPVADQQPLRHGDGTYSRSRAGPSTPRLRAGRTACRAPSTTCTPRRGGRRVPRVPDVGGDRDPRRRGLPDLPGRHDVLDADDGRPHRLRLLPAALRQPRLEDSPLGYPTTQEIRTRDGVFQRSRAGSRTGHRRPVRPGSSREGCPVRGGRLRERIARVFPAPSPWRKPTVGGGRPSRGLDGWSPTGGVHVLRDLVALTWFQDRRVPGAGPSATRRGGERRDPRRALPVLRTGGVYTTRTRQAYAVAGAIFVLYGQDGMGERHSRLSRRPRDRRAGWSPPRLRARLDRLERRERRDDGTLRR